MSDPKLYGYASRLYAHLADYTMIDDIPERVTTRVIVRDDGRVELSFQRLEGSWMRSYAAARHPVQIRSGCDPAAHVREVIALIKPESTRVDSQTTKD